ncbi:Cytochrome b-c1 complex, subunit 6,Ubiquinol-cytochrome C reductase hinge domain [Cinara cedri]|uniref:Cytochrome b-c1 complex, subunit 6,Ubiquinol-cytochrome C reductase hinge domain n=1 Tax=Cinara cedri TaxID=506608 RepID=A0A5E4NII3_9HEMI|nr:Cytochrome b-c1 complex, subunit 6,Ubiquinol-cytochrome C reductase hinge domain [Cinara cedri]
MFTSLKETIVNFVQSPFGIVKAEEELVDPAKVLRTKCEQQNAAQERFAKLQECNERVNSKKKTAETCVEELWDFLEVVDKCVAKDLFDHLK